MRLRLFARFRRPGRPRLALGGRRGAPAGGGAAFPSVPGGGRHRREEFPQTQADSYRSTQGAGPPGGEPFGSPVRNPPGRQGRPARPQTPGRAARPDTAGARPDMPGRAGVRRPGAAKAAVRPPPGAARGASRAAPGTPGTVPGGPAAARAAPGAARAAPGTARAQPGRLPWYEVAHARKLAAGRRNCGPLERLIHREWDESVLPPPAVVRAIDRLAELPATVTRSLVAGLQAIYVGAGGVPDLDAMGRLKGVPLPSGRATWDACAGAYGERKIIVGTRPSATPDVVCHEVGHALDDIDGAGGLWQSDSEEFRTLYGRCFRHLVSQFHRQEGALGRREFFADAFASIASGQRPALVDMLGGDTRTALDVMLYFNVRYRI
jgi:hypothetical protein